MNNVINLLQRIGEDSALQTGATSRLSDILSHSAIDTELVEALLAGDQKKLVLLLGANTNVFCAVLPAKDDDDTDEDEKKQDDDDDSKKDEAAMGRLQTPRRVSFGL